MLWGCAERQCQGRDRERRTPFRIEDIVVEQDAQGIRDLKYVPCYCCILRIRNVKDMIGF
jgi:hypothetical protein